MPPLDGKKAKARGLKYSDREELTCERWMTADVYTVKPLDSVAHARALLEKHRIRQLPVVKGGALIGIVTDRDLRDAVDAVTSSAKLAGMGEAAPQTGQEIRVEAVMTENVITLNRDSSLVTAAEIMRRERIGSLPIVDGRTLVGIITRSDILKAFVARENNKRAHATRPIAPKAESRRTEGGR
jgi:CBS domain-containing protein